MIEGREERKENGLRMDKGKYMRTKGMESIIRQKRVIKTK